MGGPLVIGSIQSASFRWYRTSVPLPRKSVQPAGRAKAFFSSLSHVVSPFTSDLRFLRWYRHWECGFLSRPASFSSANRFLHNERYVTTGECFGPSLLSKISRRCTLLKVESFKDFIGIKKMSNSFLSKCPLLNPSNEKKLTIHNLLSMPLEYQKTLRMHYETHSCLKIFHSIQWQRSPEIVKSRLHIIHEAIIFFSSLRYLTDLWSTSSQWKALGYTPEV